MWSNQKTLKPLWNIVWQFLKNLNVQLMYDPTIVLLDMDQGENDASVHPKTCIHMVKEVLGITAEKIVRRKKF